MNKNIFLNKKLWIFVTLSLLMFLSLTIAFMLNCTSTFADVNSLGGNFTISVSNRSAELSAEETMSYNGGTLKSYKWKNARRIILNYSPDSANLPPNDSMGQQSYSMYVSLEYLKGYTNSNFSNHVTKENVFEDEEKSNLSASELNQIFYFDIDTGVSIANSQTKAQGWGIYRFKITINGAEKYSDYVFISPEFVVDKQPSINYNVVHSTNSMHDSFEFFITNSNYFNYVDTNYIKWYVTGETTDGKKVVLTKQDLDNERFSDYDTFLYVNIERTGTTFLFNDNEIEGKWKVWCEFTNREGENHSTILASANTVEVKTSKNVKVTWVIWLVLGASAVAVAGVVGYAIYRSKKEKVW